MKTFPTHLPYFEILVTTNANTISKLFVRTNHTPKDDFLNKLHLVACKWQVQCSMRYLVYLHCLHSGVMLLVKPKYDESLVFTGYAPISGTMHILADGIRRVTDPRGKVIDGISGRIITGPCRRNVQFLIVRYVERVSSST